MKETKKYSLQEVHEINAPIFASRDEVANKIIQNLKEYGDLSAPGFYGRGFNVGTKGNGRFSSSNYLRFLANQDDRTDSNSYVSENWLQQKFPGIPNPPWLKEGAKPVQMERWTSVDLEPEELEIQGTNRAAIGSLTTFYNVDDLLHITASLPNAKRITNHDQEYDFEYAEDLLEAIGVERLPDHVRTIDEIKDAVFNYAKEQNCGDISATMTVHLFFRNCHLTPPKELFTEEMISTLEARHDKLFSFMKTATNVNYHIEKAMSEEHDKLKAEVSKLLENDTIARPEKREIKGKDEDLFKDLSIRFHRAGDWIYDIDGNQFMPNDNPSSEEKHSGIYKGENAYKFLAALNRYDKEQYNRRHRLFTGYTKCKMDFMPYLSDIRIDLGDLELENKSCIMDAFEKRVLQHYYHLLDSDLSCRYSIIHNYTDDGTSYGTLKISEEELAKKIAEFKQEVSETIPEIKKYFASLRNDEAKFIEKNPAYKEYNEYKADTYRYLVKKSFINYLEKLPMNGREHGLYFNILNKFDVPDEPLSIMSMKDRIWHSSSNIVSTDEVEGYNKDDFIIVEAYERPDSIYENLNNHRYRTAGIGNSNHVNDIKILFSPDELELAHKLDEIKYQKKYVPTNPYRDSFNACTDVEVTGFDAICQARYDYSKNIIPERTAVYEAYRNGEEFGYYHDFFYLNPKFNGHFTIDGEAQQECEFSEGQGQLQGKSFKDNFISPEKQEEFDNLYAFAGKYYYSHNSGSDMANCFFDYAWRKAAEPMDADFASKIDLDMELKVHQARHPEIDINKSKLSSIEVGDLATYYKQSVSLYYGDQKVSLNDCNHQAVRMMIEDGLSNSKINTVFACLQDRIHTTKEEAQNKKPLSTILNSTFMKQKQKDVKQKQTESIFKTKSR